MLCSFAFTPSHTLFVPREFQNLIEAQHQGGCMKYRCERCHNVLEWIKNIMVTKYGYLKCFIRNGALRLLVWQALQYNHPKASPFTLQTACMEGQKFYYYIEIFKCLWLVLSHSSHIICSKHISERQGSSFGAHLHVISTIKSFLWTHVLATKTMDLWKDSFQRVLLYGSLPRCILMYWQQS
jgi:hypothetical protein